MRPKGKRVLASLPLAALLQVACAGGAGTGVPPATSRTPLVEISKDQPLALPGAAHVSAEVRIFGILAGDLSMQLEQRCEDGRHVADMSTEMHTAGLVRLLARRDGQAQTRLSADTGLPESTHIWVTDGEMTRRYQVRYRPGAYAFTYEKTGRPPKQDVRPVPGGEHAHDMQTTVLLLRAWHPEPGTRGYFHIVLGYRVWRADVVYRGGDTIEVGEVARSAVKIEGTARKLERKPDDSDAPRKFALWFSDDEARIPLRIVGQARYGTVQFDLKAYDAEPPKLCQ